MPCRAKPCLAAVRVAGVSRAGLDSTKTPSTRGVDQFGRWRTVRGSNTGDLKKAGGHDALHAPPAVAHRRIACRRRPDQNERRRQASVNNPQINRDWSPVPSVVDGASCFPRRPCHLNEESLKPRIPCKRTTPSPRAGIRDTSNGFRTGSEPVATQRDPTPSPFRQIAGNRRRRGGSGCGGVSRMDAATELTWTYLQRPPQPDPPRHPPGNPLLPLLWRLPLIRRVQGAALPEPQHPVLATVIIPVHTSLPI